MVKGKDFIYRNIHNPEEYYRNPKDYYEDFYPQNYFENSAEELRVSKLKKGFSDFERDSPNAYALLKEMFGNKAHLVFSHLELDKLTELKCLELLTFLVPILPEEEESREYQAISTPSLDEIA
jgi:hypothetical protein